MPRLKWEKENEDRTCCYSSDKNYFYGSYWKNSKSWYAHICPRDVNWYSKEFPLDTSETKIKRECGKLINHFEETSMNWERD